MPIKLEPEYCCILLVCCGGHGERRAKAALSTKLQADAGLDTVAADKAAAWILDTFDLAPKDALNPYREAVAEMAREYPYVG